MTLVFPANAPHKAFSGTLLFQQDGATGPVFGFVNASAMVPDTDNISRVPAVDGSVNIHNEILGIRLGTIDFAAYLTPDRNFAAYMNAAFGPRTNGQLPAMCVNLKPHGTATVQKMNGIWWRRLTISGKFGVSGAAATVLVRASGLVLDPDNFYNGPTLTAPAVVGTDGLGITSFNACSVNDCAPTTPNVYDGFRSFSLTVDNGLNLNESVSSTANRLSSGCTPSPLTGVLTLDQLDNPTNPIPAVHGHYPVALLLPTGDQSHTLKIDLSVSRDGGNRSLIPTEYLGVGQSYSLFGTNAANSTQSVGHLFNAIYS